jgi:hypothetical protein
MSRAALEVSKMADELAKKRTARKSSEPKAAKPKTEKAPKVKVAKEPKEKKPKAEKPKKEKTERQVMSGLKKHPKTKRLTVRPGAASSVVMKGLKALDPSVLSADENFYRERLLARIEIRQ